jgi:hypothetical protein
MWSNTSKKHPKFMPLFLWLSLSSFLFKKELSSFRKTEAAQHNTLHAQLFYGVKH